MPNEEVKIMDIQPKDDKFPAYGDVRFWLKENDEVLTFINVRVFLESEQDDLSFSQLQRAIIERARNILVKFPQWIGTDEDNIHIS